jgi:hypothetical protein
MFELTQILRQKRLAADFVAKRRILEIISLNWLGSDRDD